MYELVNNQYIDKTPDIANMNEEELIYYLNNHNRCVDLSEVNWNLEKELDITIAKLISESTK